MPVAAPSVTATGTTEGYFTGAAYAQVNGLGLIQDMTNGNIYKVLPTAYDDAGNPIDCRMRTANIDGQTMMHKFFSCLEVIGDKVPSNAYVRYSDDDYTTFSKYRPVPLSATRSRIWRLGRGIRRAFEVRHTAATAMRLEDIEVTAEKGSA